MAVPVFGPAAQLRVHQNDNPGGLVSLGAATAGLSVIIPTHNRACYLADAIRSVLSQNLPALEIIVVDNASTDHTREVVESLQKESDIPISYVFEPVPGANVARDAGARCARGQILVFMDDDEIADDRFLSSYARTFASYPEIGCVQGGVELTWESVRPDWLTADYEGYFERYLGATKQFGVEARELEPFFYPVAGNMAVRRDLFRNVGGFGDVLVRNGRSLVLNDEFELGYKIRKAGRIIYYEPSAIIHHRVPSSRVQRRWFVRRAYCQGISDALWIRHTEMPNRRRLFRMNLDHAHNVLVHSLNYVKCACGRREGAALTELLWVAIRIGRLREELVWLCLGR